MAEETPVGNLDVTHSTLDAAQPCSTFWTETREHLIYALVGKIRVYANDQFLGTIGGRSSVTEPLAHVVRFPSGTRQDVTLVLEGFAADCLLVSCDALENRCTKLPYLHWNDTYCHHVGTDTHQRRVGEVPVPPSYHLACGETYNPPGTTSSWPPHATPADLQVYLEGKTTWDECFYMVAAEPAQTVLIGLYPGGKAVRETRMLTNGEIVRMPLGSHQVTAAPNAFCYYAWFYCGNALQKQYNKFSSDIGTYRK